MHLHYNTVLRPYTTNKLLPRYTKAFSLALQARDKICAIVQTAEGQWNKLQYANASMGAIGRRYSPLTYVGFTQL